MTAAYTAPNTLRQDCWPLIPDRLEDLGVPRSVIADLVLRYLWLHGSGTLALLNETLKLSFPLLETLFHQFRNQQLLEVKGMTGNDYSFSLTASGRTQAAGRNEICHYVGPAPDLPGSPGAETGDAWLGVFKSYDGGQSWRSTVHPGCAQKIAACDGR